MTVTIVDAARPVTGGVDTHLDLNVAAALDPVGGLLAVAEFPTTAAGHRDLLGWLSGFGEAIRALVVARRSARSAKIQTLNQIRHLSFTAPERLRQRLAGVSRQQLAARATALRPATGEGADPVIAATKTALRILGHRVLALDAEKARIDTLLSTLVSQTAPQLLAPHGVGTDTAAALRVTAGDNPGRLRSEAAWAHLCGTAPIPASSGKVTRYRLNRGGDRQANRAQTVDFSWTASRSL